MMLDAPDLRKMLVLLGNHLCSKYPDYVKQDDVKRVDEANNILLVLIRVIMAVLKRADVITSDEVKKIAHEAKYVPDPKDMFDSKPLNDGVVTGKVTSWDAIDAVDKALHDPEARGKMPQWFVVDFWPGVLRRVAQGGGLTAREKEIAMYESSKARGER